MLNVSSAGPSIRLVVGLVVLAVTLPAVASVVAGVAGLVLRSAVQLAGAFH
jgi:hypothetical protein